MYSSSGLLYLSVFASIVCFGADISLHELEPITITTATKSEKNIDGVVASVVVITKDDIVAIGAESLKDIFNQTPGLTIQYGTFPSAGSKSKGSLTLRGMGSKGTLFLIDGRRLAGEVANPYDLDRIPASEIERIEIVKGPMSTLYGADAMGGVINIITKKPTDQLKINFDARVGQNGDGDDRNQNMNLSVSNKMGDMAYSIYINHTSTTPYAQKEDADVYAKQGATTLKPSAHANSSLRANLKDIYKDVEVSYKEDSDVLTYGGRIEYDLTDFLRVGFELNAFQEERSGMYIGYFHPTKFGTAPNYVPAYNIPVNSQDENERLDLAGDINWKISNSFDAQLKAYRSYYEKRNKTTAKYYQDMGYASEEESSQNGLDANVDIRSAELLTHYALNDQHLLTMGAETRSEDRDATVFSQSNAMSSKSVDYKSLYLQDEWEISDDFNAIFGARYDDISNNDSKTTYKAGMVKNFTPALNARFNFAQGYRAPDIRELYIYKNTPTGLNRGADVIDTSVGKTSVYALKPESTNTYELGVGGLIAGTKYDLALFHNSIEDMIVEVNKGGYYTFENLSDAKTYGAELSMTHPLGDQIDTTFSWMELRTKNDDTGKRLEFNPERAISARIDYQATAAFNTSLMVKYIGDQYYQKTINRGAPTQSIIDATTDAYTTLDWNINYALDKKVSLYGGIYNLSDEKIDDVLGSSSGRYFFGGVRISL